MHRDGPLVSMEDLVLIYLPVQIGDKSNIFYMVTRNDYVDQVCDELDRQFSVYGEDLGSIAKAIKSYMRTLGFSFREIAKKLWPDVILKRFYSEQAPFIFVINTTFNEFFPISDRWGVIWFSDFYEKPGTICRLFGALANKVHQDEDLFSFLSTITTKDKFNKFGNYYDFMKPGSFGISIDAQALIEEILGV